MSKGSLITPKLSTQMAELGEGAMFCYNILLDFENFYLYIVLLMLIFFEFRG